MARVAELQGDAITSACLLSRGREEEEMDLIAYLPIAVTSLLNYHRSSPAVCSDSR